MRIRPAGDRALLCDVDDLPTAHRLRRAIITAELGNVVDVVPGWRTVLVVFDAPLSDAAEVRNTLTALPLDDVPETNVATHVIPVTYDGPDLTEVAQHTGLTVDEVVRRHTTPTYTVAFLGFLPGFPYLADMDESLATPRKQTPRTSLPAGAVGIAGAVTGIYPRSSPGGWQIIGRTERVLFDIESMPPALLAPGDRVQFEATR